MTGKAMVHPDQRRFLMLQGPHGPFFDRLAHHIRAAGSQVWRVGFNAGDRFFSRDRGSFVPFTRTLEDWPEVLATLVDTHSITDIVLYGDARPVHAEAIRFAKSRGIPVHVFEEGYMRPYWVTYERNGSNGNSRLMDMSVPQMQAALARSDVQVAEAPAHWGDMYQHIIYGALYHLMVLLRNQPYRRLASHRNLPVAAEYRTYLKRFFLMPLQKLHRAIKTHRIKAAGFPYHLVLMQLEHDASFQSYSPYSEMEPFLREVIEAFAKGAPAHHHLVFKAHPMEPGRVSYAKLIARIATDHGVTARVHYVPGGKLAQILDSARTAVTVNSTAAQQVLWRGIPLKVFGQAVYAKPEFVADQPLPQFFAHPTRPDTRAYKDYRRYLLETSQIPGGFYSASGRRQVLRQIVDLMLDQDDPYDALVRGTSAPRQQFHVVN